MKADIPFSRDRFFRAAERYGLYVFPQVTVQGVKVVALECGGPLLRFFSPDLLELPGGTQIDGYVGVAVQTAAASGTAEYSEAVFHHIVNFAEIRRADRFVEQEEDLAPFFDVLLPALRSLPSTPTALAQALKDSKGWIGKLVVQGRPYAISLQRRVEALGK